MLVKPLSNYLFLGYYLLNGTLEYTAYSFNELILLPLSRDVEDFHVFLPPPPPKKEIEKKSDRNVKDTLWKESDFDVSRFLMK